MMENREIRIIKEEDSEIRIAPDSRNVEGIGIVFNKESEDLGGFTEKIIPEAIEGVIAKSDILALVNHDQSRGLLARSQKGKGTLNFDVNTRNVKYSFEAPKFPLGDELVEGIRRGDIKGSSFAFSIAEEEWDWKRKPVPLRTIKKFDLIYDMSPCYRPAYADTTVALRNLEQIKKDTEIKDNSEQLKEVAEPEVRVDDTDTKPVVGVEPAIEPIVERIEPEVKVEEPAKEQKVNNLIHKTMTILELQDLRAQAIEQNDKIQALKRTEKRTLTEK